MNQDIDFVLTKVSYPSTGQGIELGWASFLKIPVKAIYKTGSKPSGSISVITDGIFEYQKLIDCLNSIL